MRPTDAASNVNAEFEQLGRSVDAHELKNQCAYKREDDHVVIQVESDALDESCRKTSEDCNSREDHADDSSSNHSAADGVGPVHAGGRHCDFLQ